MVDGWSNTIKFSANLGFLWTEYPLADAIRAAKLANFDAVEFHWPYDNSAKSILDALNETQLLAIGLNTRRGDPLNGDNGLAALPSRIVESRDAIDEAVSYAKSIGAQKVHVMAGVAEGEDAHAVFVSNLEYACRSAALHGLTILIEPLNTFDAPGYFLKTTWQACQIIQTVGAPNLKLMFDCYHVARTEGDVIGRFEHVKSVIGHIQFASVPHRGPPDQGDLNYRQVFEAIKQNGFNQPLGAEYRPNGPTENSLGWMQKYR